MQCKKTTFKILGSSTHAVGLSDFTISESFVSDRQQICLVEVDRDTDSFIKLYSFSVERQQWQLSFSTVAAQIAKRTGFSVALHSQKIILFGGCTSAGSELAKYPSDFLVVDLLGGQVRQIAPENQSFLGREQHSFTVEGNDILIFGGTQHQKIFNDLSLFSIKEEL